MDFAKKSGDLFFIYWLAVHILHLVHMITEIVLVTGMRFVPQWGMHYEE